MSTHASSALNMESCSKCCIQDTLSSRALGMAAFRASSNQMHFAYTRNDGARAKSGAG